jgi:hypothetical protein
MRLPTRREIWIAAMIMAAIRVWTGRYFVNPDGVSYLDLSDDFASGRWSAAVNAHWSPGYPALLALWLAPFRSGSEWETIAVHVLNGLLFLAALASFEFFLREVRRSSSTPVTPAVTFASYAVVLWSLLVLITIKSVTPDMMLAAIGFAAAAVFTRIQTGRASVSSHAIFGCLLGAAALTKSFMFSVAIVMILISLIAARRTPGAIRRHVVSALVFGMIVAPQLVAVSLQSGRPAFSDSARIVYALKVNRIPKFQVGPHVRVLSERPLVLEYPIDKANRSYPLWDEPSFWYRGSPVQFNVADQVRATTQNLRTDFGIALKILVPLIVVIFCRDRRSRMRNVHLAALSVMVIGAYALLFSEARLIGFWLALLVVSVLTGITLEAEGSRGKTGRAFVHVISVISVISFVTYLFDQSLDSRRDRGFGARHLQLDVASKLGALGIQAGSRVAVVGDESDIYWARLARVQAGVQIPLPEAPKYWSLPESARAGLNRRIALTGSRAIIASWTDPPAADGSWIRVLGTRYSILPLR